MSKKNILMIRTKDKRNFFTHQKNLPMLIEFAKTFNAELNVVSGDKLPILELDKLALSICDLYYKDNSEFEIISRIYPKIERIKDKPSADNIKNIKQYIKDRLLSNNKVSAKELREKFNNLNLTDSSIYNQLKSVKNELKIK